MMFERLLKGAIFLSPSPLSETPDTQLPLHEYRVDVPAPVSGKTLRVMGMKPISSGITAGPAGVTVAKDGELITVPFEECVAVVREGDGTHHLVGHSGDVVKVRLPRLKDGYELLALIERSIDEAKIVPLDDRADVWRRLESAIHRDLRRRWVIWVESERAPGLVGKDAEIIKVAEATVGLKAGLLILTESQLVFIAKNSGDGPDITRVHDLVDIDQARVGGIGKRDALVLRIGGKKQVFREISPVARNKKLANEINTRSRAYRS